MRVLLVGKGPPDRGGISTFLQLLLSGGLAARHELRLLNLTREAPFEGGRFTSSNVSRTLADVRAVFNAAGDADVVHIHSALAPTVTLLRACVMAAAARTRRRPVVVHAHSGRIESWATGFARRTVARLALRAATRVLVVSDSLRDALAGLVPGRLELVDNALDASRYGPPDGHDGVPRVLFAGVLTPRKGAVDLLEASARLIGEGVVHELWLAGGTPAEGPRAEDDVRAAAGASAPHVRFLGTRPHEEMADLYRTVDVFCLPSWAEAMPMSVLEAAASSLPVVATSVGGIPRVVVDGVTGRLVPPRRPDLLAEALRTVLADADMRRRLGEAGRARVREHFDATVLERRLHDIYTSVAAARR